MQKNTNSGNRKMYTEIEAKFKITEIDTWIEILRNNCVYTNTQYIRDIIYNFQEKRLRVRVFDDFKERTVEAMYKYKVDTSNKKTQTAIEETLYEGNSLTECMDVCLKLHPFEEANSYEKIRVNYIYKKVFVTLDIYPYTTVIELEGDEEDIWEAAKNLGLKEADITPLNADQLYDEWCENNKLDIFWNVRFAHKNVDGRIYKKIT